MNQSYICLDENVYQNMCESIANNRKTVVIHGTGLGKTPLVLRYLAEHPEVKPLVLGSQNNVVDTWKNAAEVKNNGGMAISIGSFYPKPEKYIDEFNLLVLDEVHHYRNSRSWGESVKKYLEFCPQVKLLGLTAEEKRSDGTLTSDFFDGNEVNGLTIDKAIENNQIWPISFIPFEYPMGEVDNHTGTGEFVDLYKNEENRKQLENIIKLHRNLTVPPKGIVYTDIQYFNDVIEILKIIFPDVEFHSISSHDSANQQIRTKEWFAKCTSGFIVNQQMLTESSHFKGINTVINFRTTRSITILRQMIGRLSVLSKEPNPFPVFFDITNSSKFVHYFKPRNPSGGEKIIDPEEMLRKLDEYYMSIDKELAYAKETMKSVFHLLKSGSKKIGALQITSEPKTITSLQQEIVDRTENKNQEELNNE